MKIKNATTYGVQKNYTFAKGDLVKVRDDLTVNEILEKNWINSRDDILFLLLELNNKPFKVTGSFNTFDKHRNKYIEKATGELECGFFVEWTTISVAVEFLELVRKAEVDEDE